MAKGGRGKLTSDHLPPVDKRELEMLRKDANTISFTSALFTEHKTKCKNATYKKQWTAMLLVCGSGLYG